MSRMSEREIQVANNEACPQCLQVYPAPTALAETVTCGGCGFCHCLPRREIPPPRDAFKWKLFTVWYESTFSLGSGDNVDALYAAWLAGYETGYDHAY